MARIDDLLADGLKTLGPKPPDTADQPTKRHYSQRMSEVVALALAEELRLRGLKDARPYEPEGGGVSGAERRMAGGLGPKKVDVTWATEASGLLLGISVKTINFRDGRSKNFQKNLTNRRTDMLMESVTLHRRFPFAVLSGLLILDQGAATDNTATRRSTFENAHSRYRLFTARDDPAGRDEQFERLFIALVDANPFKPVVRAYDVGVPETEVALADAFDDLIGLLATRNPDFHEAVNGNLVKAF